MQRYFSLLIKTLLISLILHYLFITYFPLEWFERWSPLSQSGSVGNFTVSSQIEVTLDSGEQGMLEGSSQAEGEGSGSGDSEGMGDIDQQKWGDLLERLEDNTGFAENFKQSDDEIDENARVSSAYIHRERHHEDIVVKEVFPTIYDIEQPFEEVLKVAPQTFSDYQERNEIIERYRTQTQGDQAQLEVHIDLKQQLQRSGPLYFPEAERRKFFDRTLKENKTDQLASFINQYFDYDPNEGDLPIATRELYFENLERLLYSFSADPSYFYLDFYLENLNKEDFLNNALNQAARLNGTKTATELLFALERIYEIQQRAWKVYFEFDTLYDTLPEQKKQYLRVETLRRVRERYQSILKQKNIEQFEDLENLYRERRYQILDYIVQHTPENYRKKDAVFERGVVLWEIGMEQNKPELKQRALLDWQSLSIQNQTNSLVEHNHLDKTQDDFLNRANLTVLDALIRAYNNESQAHGKQVRENQISSFLRQRQNERLLQKREREARLLWPEDKK